MIGASLTVSAAASLLYSTLVLGTICCAALDAARRAGRREMDVLFWRRLLLALGCLLVFVQGLPETLASCHEVASWSVRAVIEYGVIPAFVGGLLVGHFVDPAADGRAEQINFD